VYVAAVHVTQQYVAKYDISRGPWQATGAIIIIIIIISSRQGWEQQQQHLQLYSWWVSSSSWHCGTPAAPGGEAAMLPPISPFAQTRLLHNTANWDVLLYVTHCLSSCGHQPSMCHMPLLLLLLLLMALLLLLQLADFAPGSHDGRCHCNENS
jgi:hypothetical protein